MARLNDYAAPAESVEALKRRFVRQNRDIVRVNSMQSLRIRSLESEVSHLLAENVSLREQIINLTQEIERYESAKMLHEGIYEIKSRLDAKLAEMSTLASDLGMLPRRVGKTGADSDRPKATAEPRSRTMDSEFNAGPEDGRLPAIVEDKYYPRRTLEQQEIQNLVHDDPSFESPQHNRPMHEECDPNMESSRPDANSSPSECHLDSDPAREEAALPPTLETRKKKKRTDTAAPVYKATSQEEKPITMNVPREPTKSGSKRKFSPDEDGVLSDPVREDDEFQFSRPGGSPSKKTDPFDFMHPNCSPSKTPVMGKQGSAHSGTVKRKVLEPKISNSNLGSPKKMRASVISDKKILSRLGTDENTSSPQKPKATEIASGETLNQKPRVARLGLVSQKPKRAGRSAEVEDHLDAESIPVSKDSPVAKAGNQSFGMADMATASRPSRRRGAVVSYAEPNLRDKMRRPSKTMLDAVAGAGPRRSSSFQLAKDSLGNEADASQSITSPHPSSNATRSAGLGLTNEVADPFGQDGTSDQLLATVSRRRRKVSSSAKDLDEHPSAISMADASDLNNLSTALKGKLGTRGPSRRHSSNPKSSTRETLHGEADMASDLDSSFEADDVVSRRETRIAARRRSMMV
ncbi:Shugoshin [Penicillium rolfsii]|nr:Shugoshin [Penicillium rolfsii]